MYFLKEPSWLFVIFLVHIHLLVLHIDYFLLHHFFAMVADSYVDDWKKVVPFSNSVPHILLLRLFEPYNKECYEELKRICPFHKLAYKRTSEEFALKGTFYDVIFNK